MVLGFIVVTGGIAGAFARAGSMPLAPPPERLSYGKRERQVRQMAQREESSVLSEAAGDGSSEPESEYPGPPA